MKTFILVGETAVKKFQYEDWDGLEEAILENNDDIVSWDRETGTIVELLNILNGWDDFVELSAEDLKTISSNTKIEIDYE